MKLDLDDIERKAKAVRGELQDAKWFDAMAEYRGAASPPVVLALIARIRELEAAIVEVRNELRDGCVGQRDLDALLDKGVVLS